MKQVVMYKARNGKLFEIEAECSFCNGSWIINEIRFT